MQHLWSIIKWGVPVLIWRQVGPRKSWGIGPGSGLPSRANRSRTHKWINMSTPQCLSMSPSYSAATVSGAAQPLPMLLPAFCSALHSCPCKGSVETHKNDRAPSPLPWGKVSGLLDVGRVPTPAGISCGLGVDFLILLNPARQDWECFSQKVGDKAGGWSNTLVKCFLRVSKFSDTGRVPMM